MEQIRGITLLTIVLLCAYSIHALDQNGHICIIGGGISGLTVAASLQSKGYKNVDLYEAENTLGGKIVTYRATGSSGKSRVIETGPVIYYRSMTHTARYMNQLNLTSVPYNRLDISLFNPASGVIYPKIDIPAKLIAVVQEATNRYKEYWHELAPALELGYTSTLYQSKLAELSTPIETWLNDRNLSILVPLLAGQYTGEGYGDLKDVPILYALKPAVENDAETYFQIGENPLHPVEGFDTFVTRFAETIRKKPNLGWRAIDIKRNKGQQQVTFSVEGRKSPVVVTCSRTILAFPPLLRNLAVLVSDLSFEERRVLDQVKIMKYAASGILVPNLKLQTYSGLVPEIGLDFRRDEVPKIIYPRGDGGPVMLVRQDKGGEVCYVAYTWIYGHYDAIAEGKDIEVMAGKLNATLKKIHPFSKTLFTRATEYFPHVTGQSMRNGFYQDFDAIQGNGGLYYATPLLSFETISNSIEMGEGLVDKYF